MGLHARMNAKVTTFLGLITIICAIGMVFDWGIFRLYSSR